MFNLFETKKETLWEKQVEKNQEKYTVPLILILLIFVALILLLPGCSADKKDEVLGTYQEVNKNSDNYFIVFEKTEGKNNYRMMDISVKENSDKMNIFNQGIVTLDTQEKNTRIVNISGAIIGEYSAENKLLNFTNNTTYKKISDKKLNTEEMRKLVTKYYSMYG